MTADESRKIETTSTQLVYENRWMRVREDTIRRRDGSNGIYSVVEKPDFVVIIPVEDDGRLYLVEQFRYLVTGRYWEFPQGSWEQIEGADPLEMARRIAGGDRSRRCRDDLCRSPLRSLRLLQSGLPHLPRHRPAARRRRPGARGARSRDAALCTVRSGADDLRRPDQGRHDGRRARSVAAERLTVEAQDQPPVR